MSHLRPNSRFIKSVPSAVRKKWHDALLSTDKGQAHGKMRSHNNRGTYYCCLMVAHEAFGGIGHGNSNIAPGPDSPFSEALTRYIGGNKTMDGVPDIAQLYNASGDCISVSVSAVACNDIYKLTFEQIAKLVYPHPHLYGRVRIEVERPDYEQFDQEIT